MLRFAVKPIRDYERIANKLIEHQSHIENNLANNNFIDNLALLKILYLAITDTTKRWTELMREWLLIYSQLAFYFMFMPLLLR